MITIISAMDMSGLIGNGDKLPWHLPQELKHFKSTTMNQNLVMGRKTYESVGALPGRKTYVLSHKTEPLETPLISWVTNAKDILQRSAEGENFYIAGGREIYDYFIPYADEMLLTTVHGIFDGDVFFPEYDASEWHSTIIKNVPVSEENSYEFTVFRKERAE